MSGFARQTSVDVGEPMDLVVSGPNGWLAQPGDDEFESVEVEIYRLGYYDGSGGRLVWKTDAPVSTFQKVDDHGIPSNSGTVPPPFPIDPDTGLLGQSHLRTTVTVPGSALSVSGVYLAKFKGRWFNFGPGLVEYGQGHAVFVVRDDQRPRDLLCLLPTNTWQAYNYWGGRSLYTYSSRYQKTGSIVPTTGTERASRVSFDRPHTNFFGDLNWVLRTEFPMIWWLERHGYDVSYTEDVALSFAPEQALPELSRGVAIFGHGEYWTQEMRDGLGAARDAGTNLYNFGANTAYWRVRLETQDGLPATGVQDARVLVCYKTVEGGGASLPTIKGTADGSPSTTTFRDPGHGPGIPNGVEPNVDYVGPAQPEAELLGVQYSGDDDVADRAFHVPADNGAGEFAGHRAWRHTSLATQERTTGATIGTALIGWEWDAVPPAGHPFGGTPPTTKPGTGGLRRLSETDPRTPAPIGATTAYVLDAGRRYSRGDGATPPPNGSPYAHATTYVAPSGALVFSAGTIQWAWGLAPHYDARPTTAYNQGPVDSDVDPRIVQATANLLRDGGIKPLTPFELIIDPDPQPEPEPEPAVDPPAGGPPTADPPAQPRNSLQSPPSSDPPASQPTAVPALAFVLDRAEVSLSGRLAGRVIATVPVSRTTRGAVEVRVGKRRVARGTFLIKTGHRRSKLFKPRLNLATRTQLRNDGRLTASAVAQVRTGSPPSRAVTKRIKLVPAKRRS